MLTEHGTAKSGDFRLTKLKGPVKLTKSSNIMCTLASMGPGLTRKPGDREGARGAAGMDCNGETAGLREYPRRSFFPPLF